MKKKEEEKRIIYQSSYFDEKYIIETIYHNKTPKFAILNGTIEPEVLGFAKPTEELWLHPYRDPFGNLSKRAVLLPTDIGVKTSTENLLADIKSFISSYAYMPDFWLDLGTYYALLSWIFDRFSSIGYLEFLGDKDSGKTRISKSIAECCYNTVKMNGAASVPALYRLIERYRGTLLIDEADYKSTEFDSEIAKIINSGYTVDGVVWRCDVFEKDYEPRAYNVYGPKILAHREKYKDDATGSRCISYITPKDQEVAKNIPTQLPPEFGIQGEKIRNKALRWRFENVRKFKVDIGLGEILKGRYREIAIPILNIVRMNGDSKFEKLFIEYMKESSSEAKECSEAGMCVQALRKLVKKNPKFITISDLTIEINELYQVAGDQVEMKNKAVGHLARLLGFLTVRKTDGYRIILDAGNQALLAKVFHDYPELEGV